MSDDDNGYKPPQPKYPLHKNVIKDVKEPKIEFHENCILCEVPLADDQNTWCDECRRDMVGTLHGVWSPAQKKLKN